MPEQWIIDLTAELQLSNTSPDQELYAKSIYRVPKILTDIDPQAYEPILASLGPYHHGRPHLCFMERHKRHALNQFLSQIDRHSKTLEDVVNAMREVEPRLFASYDSLHIENYNENRDEFLKLMIIDGCFALEVMLAEVRRSRNSIDSEYDSEFDSHNREDDTQYRGYNSHDPVFGTKKNNYFASYLANDMLLLENQLPFLALTILAAIEGSEVGDVSTLIKKFYNLEVPTEQHSHPPKHILDLYREIRTAKGKYRLTNTDKHSATDLRNAGVIFRNNESNSFRDITFKDDVLSIPRLEINGSTESVLLNLIAFEQLHHPVNKNVTAYAIFMSNLIDTVDDIALLKTRNIIKGIRGSDKDIADMFNKIVKGAIRVDVRVRNNDDNVNEALDDYYKKRMWRASFVKMYLYENRWDIISMYALVFTVVQTFYTIKQYNQQ